MPLFKKKPISGDTMGSLPIRNGFDSRYWSVVAYVNNSPILTIYLYLIVFVTFFLFYQDVARNTNLPLLSDLHDRGHDRFRRVAFTIILLTFLGTPLTLGFTYKLIVLSNLTTYATATAAVINLIMLVFYLQASRHPQLNRKKRQLSVTQDVNTSTKSWLVFSLVIAVGALYFVPVITDIIGSFWS